MSIFRGTTEKLGLLGVVTVDPSLQAQALSQSVGEEISRVLTEQRDLEAKFENLISARAGLKGSANRNKLKEFQAEVQKVAIELRQKTRQLCRNLKDNPNVGDNMAKVATVRQQMQLMLSDCIAELGEVSYPVSLHNRVQADKEHEVEVKATIERERIATAEVKGLRQNLKSEREEFDEEMKNQRRIMAELKELLKDLNSQTHIETAYTKKDVEAKNDTFQRIQDSEVLQLEHEIDQLKAKIDIEKKVHSVSMQFLKKKQVEMQEEVLNWSNKYENDTQNKDKDLESLKLNHQRDLVKLKELEIKYKEELAAKEQRELEARRDKEEAIQADHDQETVSRAALKIQALWRGHRARASSTKKGKGGKKGKKK